MISLKKKIIDTNIGSRLLLKYHTIREKYLNRLNDTEFAQRTYRKAGLGELNLKDPKTFDEKLWWLKINYRDDLMTDCTDKVKVREYVKSKGLGHILNKIHGVYDNSKSINWTELPDEFYLKTNHTSATNIYIKNKKAVNKKDIEKK